MAESLNELNFAITDFGGQTKPETLQEAQALYAEIEDGMNNGAYTDEQVAEKVNSGNYNQLDENVLDAIVEHVTPESLQCKIIQHIGGEPEETRDRLKRMPEPYSKLGEFGCHPQFFKCDGFDTSYNVFGRIIYRRINFYRGYAVASQKLSV